MPVPRNDLLLTATAPVIWGSTYLVTTEMLPTDFPLTVAMLRALPAGLLLLLFVRRLPSRVWLGRIFILGGLLGMVGAALTYFLWFRASRASVLPPLPLSVSSAP